MVPGKKAVSEGTAVFFPLWRSHRSILVSGPFAYGGDFMKKLPKVEMVLPYHPQDTASSLERLVLTCREIAFLYVDEQSPEEVADWLRKQDTTGWSNVRVFLDGDRGLRILGDRMETDEEYKYRQKIVRSRWKAEYKQHLQTKKFYESPMGQARLAEIKKNG